jgi:hypothetical protein
MTAFDAALAQPAGLSDNPVEASGWPERIDTVTTLVRSETVPRPNMGHACESATTIAIQRRRIKII